MKRKRFLFIGLLFAMMSDVNAATTVDDGAFGSIWDALAAWMQGSLGYIIAILGMLGSILLYMLRIPSSGYENRLTILFFGMLVSLFAGASVGIVRTMVSVGQGTFN
jgi:hypothetical protein